MTPLQKDDKFPTNYPLSYIPFSQGKDNSTTSGDPVKLDLKSVLSGNKVVITAAIGAFTKPCSEQHLPSYLSNIDRFKKKGVSKIVVLTVNDPFVNHAWAKSLGYEDKDNYVIFATDPDVSVSKELGENYVADMSALGLGLRTGRYAAIVNDGHIQYLESEEGGDFTESTNANSLLNRL